MPPMLSPNTFAFGALAALALLASHDGARLSLAFEDRADPNPRQFALAAKAAGLGVQLVISWTAGDTRKLSLMR
jgi:hypothetical protein